MLFESRAGNETNSILLKCRDDALARAEVATGRLGPPDTLNPNVPHEPFNSATGQTIAVGLVRGDRAGLVQSGILADLLEKRPCCLDISTRCETEINQLTALINSASVIAPFATTLM